MKEEVDKVEDWVEGTAVEVKEGGVMEGGKEEAEKAGVMEGEEKVIEKEAAEKEEATAAKEGGQDLFCSCNISWGKCLLHTYLHLHLQWKYPKDIQVCLFLQSIA